MSDRERYVIETRRDDFMSSRMATSGAGVASGMAAHTRHQMISEFRGAAYMNEDGGEGWLPMGPTTVENGEAASSPRPGNPPRPEVSGRVNSLALAGNKVFVAAANGGVWRSIDRGATWEAMMEAEPSKRAFDEDPEHYMTDSLACGAIAAVVDPGDAGLRLYVGSGEAFDRYDSYYGVGPLFSNDGGEIWKRERTASAGTDLEGTGFFEIAAAPAREPGTPDLVFAATRKGLFKRLRAGNGSDAPQQWERVQLGSPSEIVTSVVVARQDDRTKTVFYAAVESGPVYYWEASSSGPWKEAGSFPSGQVRVALAVRGDAPDVVYALTQLGRVFRLHRSGNSPQWREVTEGLPRGTDWKQQGSFNLAIARAPRQDAAPAKERIYIGMAGVLAKPDGRERPGRDSVISGALYRCEVDTQVKGADHHLSTTSKYIGSSVHADIHDLEFDDEDRLWVGCDGGVFRSTIEPSGARDDQLPGLFLDRNDGLSTMTLEHLGQAADDPETLFCGSQDNGCLQYLGWGRWRQVQGADSGAALVGSKAVLISGSAEKLYQLVGGETGRCFPEVKMDGRSRTERVAQYPPLVSAPDDRDLAAFGTERVWLSAKLGGDWDSLEQEGGDWRSIPTGQYPGDCVTADRSDHVVSLAFATSQKLYAGTNKGRVLCFVRAPGAGDKRQGWSKSWEKRLDPEYRRPVTDIAIDLAFPCGDGLYITLGGMGDFRRVFHRAPGEDFLAKSGKEPILRFKQPGAPDEDVAALDGGRIPDSLRAAQGGGTRFAADPMVHVVIRSQRWYATGEANGSKVLLEIRKSGSDLVVSQETDRLLAVQHNTILVDPDDPRVLYVGADIGIWRSRDSGESWHYFSRGLPDAAVLNLQVFPPVGQPALPSGVRRLRAATFGRGLFERVTREDELVEFRNAKLERALGMPLDQWDRSRRGTDWQQRPVADLRNSDLSRVYLRGIDLIRVELDGSDLSDSVIRDCNLTASCLRGCNLERAQISFTHFSGAELGGARLRQASLTCNLGGARFDGADLTEARLHGSRVGDTRWNGARVHGADLSDVDLRPIGGKKADWRGVRYDASTRWPTGFDPAAEGAVLEGS